MVLDLSLLRRRVASEGSCQHDALQLALSLSLHLTIQPLSLGLTRILDFRLPTTHGLTGLHIVNSLSQ